MASFDQAIPLVLKHEGGYVRDPRDPGGETKFGISKREYPDEDIKSLTEERAKEIYRRDYWDKIQGDKIKSQKLANNLFDAAVNTGVRRASKQIQKLVGVKQDGWIGPVTLKAINSTGDSLNLRFALERVKFYTDVVRNNAVMRRYLVGWLSRVMSYR